MRTQRTGGHLSAHAHTEAGGLLTVEEYARLEEFDELRSELVRGVLVPEPRPGARHGSTQARLSRRLLDHVEQEGLGGVFTDAGVIMPGLPRTVRGPDAAFYAAGHVPEPLPEGFLDVAPDLAVEIISASNTATELLDKVTEHLSVGTRLVWVVDPSSGKATVYRSLDDIRILAEHDELDGGEVLPGFRVPLKDVLP